MNEKKREFEQNLDNQVLSSHLQAKVLDLDERLHGFNLLEYPVLHFKCEGEWEFSTKTQKKVKAYVFLFAELVLVTKKTKGVAVTKTAASLLQTVVGGKKATRAERKAGGTLKRSLTYTYIHHLPLTANCRITNYDDTSLMLENHASGRFHFHFQIKRIDST